MDELQLLGVQLVLPQELLEGAAAQPGDLVRGEGQLHLQGTTGGGYQFPVRDTNANTVIVSFVKHSQYSRVLRGNNHNAEDAVTASSLHDDSTPQFSSVLLPTPTPP